MPDPGRYDIPAARSGTRGLPPLGFAGSFGSSGSMASHSSSLTSSFAMTGSVASSHYGFAMHSLSLSGC